MIVWRVIRALFLLVAIVCLGYTGWIYFDEYWHQREESEALDKERESPPAPKPPSRPEGPMRARLSIPRLSLSTMVEEGVTESTLRRSAGHIPGTALPGRPGNVGVAAHRDSHFRSLSGIRARDQILLTTLEGDYRYEVMSTKIVSPEDVTVLAPTKGQNTLTLVTCYPFYFVGHAPNRFIVRARQIEVGQVGNLRPIGNRPVQAEQPARRGPTPYRRAERRDSDGRATAIRSAGLAPSRPRPSWQASRPVYPTAAKQTKIPARTNRKTSPRTPVRSERSRSPYRYTG